MQRIARFDLPHGIVYELDRLQAQIGARLADADFNPLGHWDHNRRSQTILAVLRTLKLMAGILVRCLYCVDSAGTDIEHFWPKSQHPDRMYAWENLLLACAQCGRLKGTQFPRTPDGSPLLIDPKAEDPWEFLDFDPGTGNLNARYVLHEETFSAKGESTVKVLHLDRREGVAEGYLKTYRRLSKLVMGWSEQVLPMNYLEQLRDADDHGLLGWCLSGSGQNEPPFARFRERYPEQWQACRESFL